MRIITVQFDYPGNDHYQRLFTAFKNSCKINAPDSEFVRLNLKPPEEHLKTKRSVISNTIKLKAWVDELEKSNEPTLLVDCDMLMLRPLDDVWDMEFDIAFTYREDGCNLKSNYPYRIDENGRRIRVGPKPHPDAPVLKRGKGSNHPPYNGGVMFIRPNDKSIHFMKSLLRINNMMVNDPKLHAFWRRVYAGTNQAAFGYIMERERDKLNCDMKGLSCTEWNSCDDSWLQYKEGFTRMLHIKGALRPFVLGLKPHPKEVKSLVKLWKSYENGDM